jgi:hypothetical protein
MGEIHGAANAGGLTFRRWRGKNRADYNATLRAYRAEHREELRAFHREWSDSRRVHHREYQRRRRALIAAGRWKPSYAR